MKKKAEQVEWHDVQGLVLSGYPQLPYAAYIPWRIVPPIENSKVWLGDLIARLLRADEADPGSSHPAPPTSTHAHAGSDPSQPAPPVQPAIAPGRAHRPTDVKTMKKLRKQNAAADVWVVNVALTKTGLEKLGVKDEELSRFSLEFLEGMAPARVPAQNAPQQQAPRRCNILGDVAENSPEQWEWGGWNKNGEIDGLLLLYAQNPASLNALIAYEKQRMRGVTLLTRLSAPPGQELILEGQIYPDRKEHFGFTDGISQPIIEGTSEAKRLSAKERRILVVKPGEFVLGYPGERGDRVGYASAPQSEAGTKKGPRDLARSGSYLVFRQLEQNVPAFRHAMAVTAARIHGKSWEWVAERVVGRKLDGEPLIPPSTDLPSKKDKPRNNFLFYFEDRFGLACPLGAHIRRANPRDIIGPDPDTALRLSKMHRLIRRGRSYGPQWKDADGDKSAEKQGEKPEQKAGDDQNRQPAADTAPSLKPLDEVKDEHERGLFFICLNANIAGQFELIQHSWVNNGRFNGLHGESDPLLHYPGENRVLTIQRRPACDPIENKGLEQFVCMRGGAYFFLPGIKALRSLAQSPGAGESLGSAPRQSSASANQRRIDP
jgi:Dyp-type peroxidase family